MSIFAIPAFRDNYIWCWLDPKTQTAWVVDPGDAEPVITTLNQLKIDLAGILLTHHHHDHSGGIAKLIQVWPQIAVYGSTNSTVSTLTKRLKEGDQVHCGPLHFNILEIPGHTLDHLAFWNEQILFSGDTLFSAGCGKVFEGTLLQMFQSLQKLLSLPPTIQIYCGHEYTKANLDFAQVVEPSNTDIRDKLVAIQGPLQNHEPTLPVSLEEELKVNPFLRCSKPAVIQAAEHQAQKPLMNEQEVFSVLREWKNSWNR